MVGFPRFRSSCARPVAWGLFLAALVLVEIGADAKAAPLRFNITDLGREYRGSGLDNDGNVIANPVRDVVGTYDPTNKYFLPSDDLRVVDGTADGRLLINGDGAFYSPYRHTSQAYVYYPATRIFPAMADRLTYQNATFAGGVDMNEHGDVVGSFNYGAPYAAAPHIPSVPFFYQAGSGGGTWLLNDLISPGSGWNLTDVLSINDRRQILAVGRNPNQELTYALLTPEGVSVPEPGSWLVVGVAAGAFAWRRRGSFAQRRI